MMSIPLAKSKVDCIMITKLDTFSFNFGAFQMVNIVTPLKNMVVKKRPTLTKRAIIYIEN